MKVREQERVVYAVKVRDQRGVYAVKVRDQRGVYAVPVIRLDNNDIINYLKRRVRDHGSNSRLRLIHVTLS